MKSHILTFRSLLLSVFRAFDSKICDVSSTGIRHSVTEIAIGLFITQALLVGGEIQRRAA